MKKRNMLVTLAGLAAVLATTATVAAYTLAGNGTSAPAGESAGTQEPAFQDDKLPTSDPLLDSTLADTIYDGNGSVSVTNPDAGGATGAPVTGDLGGKVVNPGDQTVPKVLPDEGGEVPIGKFDGDPEPTHGDPKVEGDEPGIKPDHGTAVGEISPANEAIDPSEYARVLELAKLDMAERLGLADTDPISLAKIAGAEWNTSLGNPQPGIVYADVLVHGFKMLLEAGWVLLHVPYQPGSSGVCGGNSLFSRPERPRFRRRVRGSRRGGPSADSQGGRGGLARRGNPGRPRHGGAD